MTIVKHEFPEGAGLQLVEYVGAQDIAGMDCVVAVTDDFRYASIEVAVGVGQDANLD